MPTYVYACRECDERLEVFQKMSDDPLTECEQCGGRLRRVLFPPAVVYKGSGFYTTDYRNNGRKEEAGEGKNGSTAGSKSESSGSAGEAKTESAAASPSPAGA